MWKRKVLFKRSSEQFSKIYLKGHNKKERFEIDCYNPAYYYRLIFIYDIYSPLKVQSQKVIRLERATLEILNKNKHWILSFEKFYKKLKNNARY